MRLIDVDGVKDLLAELLMGVDGGTDASYLKTYEVIDRIEKIVNEWVDNQPTVEAIPIEWIKKWVKKTFDIESQYEVYPLIELMLLHWEKENEKS